MANRLFPVCYGMLSSRLHHTERKSLRLVHSTGKIPMQAPRQSDEISWLVYCLGTGKEVPGNWRPRGKRGAQKDWWKPVFW